MPQFTVVGPLGPEALDYGIVAAASPIHALHQLHVEALGRDAVALIEGVIVFADPADAELCAGVWKVIELGRNGAKGSSTVEICIAMPLVQAA